MERYEIIYDWSITESWTNADGEEEYYSDEAYNIREEFEGTYDELKEHLEEMKESGCFNFSVNAIPEYEDEEDESFSLASLFEKGGILDYVNEEAE